MIIVGIVHIICSLSIKNQYTKSITIDNLANRYNPVSANPGKGSALYEYFTNTDYADYLKVWLAQGIRHSDSYWNALLAKESGWVSWTK